MFLIMIVDWRGPVITSEQQMVLRHVAVRLMTGEVDGPKVYFSHKLCEGVIKQEEEGVLGATGGTFFVASFDQVDGQPWWIKFLIPSRTENADFPADNSIVIASTPG